MLVTAVCVLFRKALGAMGVFPSMMGAEGQGWNRMVRGSEGTVHTFFGRLLWVDWRVRWRVVLDTPGLCYTDVCAHACVFIAENVSFFDFESAVVLLHLYLASSSWATSRVVPSLNAARCNHLGSHAPHASLARFSANSNPMSTPPCYSHSLHFDRDNFTTEHGNVRACAMASIAESSVGSLPLAQLAQLQEQILQVCRCRSPGLVSWIWGPW